MPQNPQGFDVAEQRKWLEALFIAVTKVEQFEWTANMSGTTHKYDARVKTRKLTREEFEKFLEVAKNFLCEPVNCQMGFNFGLRVYYMHDLPGIPPEQIFFISGEYLPVGMDHKFAGSWEALSPLSHSKENIRRLKFYKFKEPQSMAHYDY